MKPEINFTIPYEETGFVEYKRAFAVGGELRGDIPGDASLVITLFNSAGAAVRVIRAKKKNGPVYLFHPDLTFYPHGIDDGREGLKEFGMPELCLDENGSALSFTNAEIKCFFSDTFFKGVFISATDVPHGAIWDDGVHFTDGEGRAYELLPEGEYFALAVLSQNGEELCRAEKKIVIGRRHNQLICRFHPESHKDKVVKWARENGYAAIIEPLPGYLDPYRGWVYHMGLLKMYRANDIALFETPAVRMFVYMIDGASTSYETELAYLQSVSAIEERLHCYYYDAGEADFCGLESEIKEFSPDEYVVPVRVDSVRDSAEENRLKLSGEDVISASRAGNAEISANADFAVMGVIKPVQMDPADFVLNDDNTYTVNNAPDKVEYTFTVDGDEYVETRNAGLTRFWDGKSDNSVFEFYNVFKVLPEWKGKTVRVKGRVIDKKGKPYPSGFSLEIKING